MRRKLAARFTLILTACIIVGLLGSPVFAGKTWSSQKYSKEKGIAVIGSENKFGEVFGFDIPNKKQLWKVKIPQSKDVSITIEGDTVYLVGKADMGITDKSIVAHELAGPKTLWAKKIQKYTRTTGVFFSDKALYFGGEIPFRGTTKMKVYAIDKSKGDVLWEKEPGTGLGTVLGLFKTDNGDPIAYVEEHKMVEEETTSENGAKDVKNKTIKTLKFVKLDGNTGDVVWEKEITGKLPFKPVLKNNRLCYVERITQGEVKRDSFVIQDVNGESAALRKSFEDAGIANMPIFEGNQIILITGNRKIYSLNTSAESSMDYINWELTLEEDPQGEAMIVNNTIYLLSSRMTSEGLPANTLNIISLVTGELTGSYKINGLTNSSMRFVENSILIPYDLPVMAKDKSKSADEAAADKKVEDAKPKTFYLLNYDTVSGSVLWDNEFEGKLESPPEVIGDKVYLFTAMKHPKGDKKEGQSYYVLSRLSIASGEVNWKKEMNFTISTQPETNGNSIIFGLKDGSVYSVNSETGEQEWKYYAGVENTIDTKIINIDGNLAFATQLSEYYIINSDGKVEKKWNKKPIFAFYKLPIFVGMILLGGAVWWYIESARSGKDMFIRKIAGLNAIEEAVGRSTEMGKPVLYVTGLADVDDIQTLASLSIMGHIAQKTAEYDTPLIVPCCRSVVMSTAQEVVKESYLKAGRPDTYRRENIYYLTDDQFGYVAGVDGIMVREKPAANFYMGKFYAESLILAETGHSTGAIQIAGTAESSQLPFFVAACDYTLIGEELFAASAYLSKDPMQIGSLKGQDLAKAIILIAIIAGCVLYSFDLNWVKDLLSTQ